MSVAILTQEDDDCRKVEYSEHRFPLVLTIIGASREIETEIHLDTVYFFRFEHSPGTWVIDGNEYNEAESDANVTGRED